MSRTNILKALFFGGIILTSIMSSCTIIDEDEYGVKHIQYQYLNNVGEDATEQVVKMTDFIFTKDSVLFRVDDDIMNGHRRNRPINLPDGEWIVITYGNLYMNQGSKVDYTIGRTHLRDMRTRVVAESTYGGTYAPGDEDDFKLGNADPLYFGKANLKVKNNGIASSMLVSLSNVHLRMEVNVRWKDGSMNGVRENENLHARLEFVPVEHSFVDKEKMDGLYKIPYRTPQATAERVTYVSKLYPVANTNDTFQFSVYGLRWDMNNDEIPVLKFYNGSDKLITTDLPLSLFFNDQQVDLKNTRVQFFQLLVLVDGENVSIDFVGINDWEDGGDFGSNGK